MNFVKAVKAEPLKNRSLRTVSVGLGIWTIVISVTQMVTFEAFVDAMRSYHVAGERGTLVVAIGLLALEIYSVPFWLRLALSPAARMVSAGFALVVPYIWTLLMLIGFLTSQNVPNAGYFGGLIPVSLGEGMALTINLVWMTLVTISFSTLGGWRAMRPYGRRSS